MRSFVLVNKKSYSLIMYRSWLSFLQGTNILQYTAEN